MPETKKILLVDDNTLVLEMMGKALGKEGFECLKASSAAEAMKLLAGNKPDVILSDYHMPVTDGFQFRQQLLGSAEYRDIPFMFLTSEVDNDLMLQGMHMDAVDYILKDTPVPVIVTKIDNFLASVREQHERTLKELSREAMALNLHSVPKHIPEVKGFDINIWHKPYQNYPGGDFIDIIRIDERYTFVVLGDVMGKKWGAWYFSFGFLSYIRAAVRICIAEGNFSTKDILQKINSVVYHDPVVNDVLSSVSLLLIDAVSAAVTYSGAGDLPLLYYDHQTGTSKDIRSEGMLLGLMNDGDFDEVRLTMRAGDQLCMYTDGLIDSETPDGKKTDRLALANALATYWERPFEDFRSGAFIQNKAETQVDDCSLIHIKRTEQ